MQIVFTKNSPLDDIGEALGVGPQGIPRGLGVRTPFENLWNSVSAPSGQKRKSK